MFATACGEHHKGSSVDAGGGSGILPQIVISPNNVMMMVTDGSAVTQPYTAMLVEPDGTSTDVTNEVTFSLANPTYGVFAGATLSVTGAGAGPSILYASMQDATTGSAIFTVYVTDHRVEGTLPMDGSVPGLFASATEDPTRAPTIAYPTDGIIVPPNLGQFDVHWTDATVNDTWDVEMTNQYIDLHVYTQGLDPTHKAYTLFQPDEWQQIASAKSEVTMTVAGIQLASPAAKGTSTAQHVEVTNENAAGGMYYWSTTSGNEGIFRYDVGTPNVPPSAYVTQSSMSGHCVGCHALSRDGTKIALTLDGNNGPGTVLNVADKSSLIPYGGANQLNWNFAAFTTDSTKLVTDQDGVLQLRDANGGAVLAAIPNSAANASGAFYGAQPEVSPDNTQLVNVESHVADDPFLSGGDIVIRSYDGNITFGTQRILVPYDPVAAHGNYYPSFSPDGQWVVYTTPNTGDGSYNNAYAEIWVVKSDGTLPPMRLGVADLAAGSELTTSWARWVPFAESYGTTNEPMFYLTFSSKRAFGVRIPGGGQPQIWMTPFFPARALAGTDPSGSAFRVPFQDVTTTNHIAQWTEQVVGIN